MNGRWLAAVACVLLATAGCNSQSSPPGKFEIAIFEVPAEVLEKMAAVKSDTAFSPEWESPLLKFAPEHNPFMVEVDYEGETTGAGRAENIFELVWFGLNGESGGPLQMLRVVKDPAPEGTQPHVSKIYGPPISFKKEQQLTLKLRLDKHNLMTPQRVTVRVRSGLGDPTWIELIMSFRFLLVGVVMFGLWWKWFRRP